MRKHSSIPVFFSLFFITRLQTLDGCFAHYFDTHPACFTRPHAFLLCLHAACPAVCGLVSGSTKTTYSIGQGPCMNYEKSFLVKSKKHVGDGFIPYFCLKWRKKFRSHLDRQCKHIGVTASVLFLLVSDFFLLFLDCEECVCWKVFRFHWASRQSAAE